MDEDQLGALIETIYTSAFEEDGWGKLLEILRKQFHASQASVAVFGGRETYPPFAVSTLDPVSLEPYSVYYYRLAPAIPGNNLALVPKNVRVFQTTELLGYAAWINSEFHNDFLKSYDMSLPLVSYLDEAGDQTAYFVAHRPASSKDYSQEEVNLLRTLAPHLSRGLRIYREMTGLRAKASQFEAAFDTFAASFLLDHAGRVLALNRKAEELLAADGPLTVQNGRLTARHPPDQAELDAALSRQAPGAPPPELVLHGPAYCPAVRLSIMPVNGAGNIPLFFDVTRTARGAFLVTAVALGPTVQSLTANYRLTRAEAEVAQLLAQGLKAQQIAAHRCASVATVNTQIKQVYAKTCVDGHAGLMVKLLGR